MIKEVQEILNEIEAESEKIKERQRFLELMTKAINETTEQERRELERIRTEIGKV